MASSSIQGSDQKKDVDLKKVKKQMKAKLLVLFVGNISYKTTKEDIEHHFEKTGGVTDVRIITHKETGESRGFAYVQFKNKPSLKRGLELHHSRLSGRKINVELTAPGRGKSQKRKTNIERRNNLWKKQIAKQHFKKQIKSKNSGR